MNRTIYLLLVSGLLLAGCQTNPNPETKTTDREVIATPKAPEAIGPYSQGIRVGNTLYLAGQVGLDSDTGQLVGDGLEPQARRSLDNLNAVLEAAGYRMADVVEAQVFLADMDDYRAFNTIYAEYFDEAPPSRAVVEVARLPLDAKVEIKMTAVR